MEVLWQFSRPHTVIGTTLSLVSLQLLAMFLVNTTWDYGRFSGAWLACLAGNVAIVGINQITDLEIDRINKPNLPLPAGLLTIPTAWQIVGVSLVIALTLSAWLSPYLLGVVALSLGWGLSYSLPPLRLKRFAVWSAVCIIAVRGAIVNVGLFWYFANEVNTPPLIWLLTGFMVVLGLIISLCKDVPDTEGDRLFQVQTFSLRWGRATVLRVSRRLLILLYVLAGLGAVYLGLWVLGVSLLACALLPWLYLPLPHAHDQAQIAQFYQDIWRLFYLSYLLFPLAGLHG